MSKWKKYVLCAATLVVSIMFLPVAILLFVGMMPTIAAYFIDRTDMKLNTITIGCVNFAFCFSYLLDLVSGSNTAQSAIDIITPEALIKMYLGAVLGYIIKWICVLISVYLTRQKNKRLIKKYSSYLERLVEKWGEKVTGTIASDDDESTDKTAA